MAAMRHCSKTVFHVAQNAVLLHLQLHAVLIRLQLLAVIMSGKTCIVVSPFAEKTHLQQINTNQDIFFLLVKVVAKKRATTKKKEQQKKKSRLWLLKTAHEPGHISKHFCAVAG
jgi:acyl-CoA hydrolase